MKETIIFSHGKESGPNGKKITALSQIAKENRCDVIAIDYTNCKNVIARIDLLKITIKNLNTTKIILVGSSMGGYVSAVIANTISVKGLFLLNPAFYLDNYMVQKFKPKTKNTTLIVGWNDKIVPCENGIKFAKKHKANLHLLDDNHRFKDSLKEICFIFEMFLKEK